jgi:hypothetical protein
MNFHTPQNQSVTETPFFAVKNNTLVSLENEFLKKDYPTLPYDMVKITAQDGRKIYIPRNKLSSADY